MKPSTAEELVRRLAAAVRGADLYSPNHPLVVRSLDGLTTAATDALRLAPSVAIGFIGDEVVVNSVRLARGSAALAGFARDLRERQIEKITMSPGLTRDEVIAKFGSPSPHTKGSTGMVGLFVNPWHE